MRSMRRKGFTLIELLVVIAIIALLISILLPSLGAAREQANKVKCSANLHAFGQSTTLYAQDHAQHLPCTQLGVWGQPPFWYDLVYTGDFLSLKDDYGLKYGEWVCASKAPASNYYNRMNFGYLSFSTLAQFKAQEAAAYAIQNGIGFPDPWAYSGADGGTGNAKGLPPAQQAHSYINDFLEIEDYENMFANPWRPAGPQPYFVSKAQGTANFNSATFPALAAYNGNPPIIADATWVQNGAPVRWGHGRTWTLGSPIDPNTWTTTAQVGDVNMNVLYADGHAENKKPERTAYLSGGGSYWFY